MAFVQINYFHCNDSPHMLQPATTMAHTVQTENRCRHGARSLREAAGSVIRVTISRMYVFTHTGIVGTRIKLKIL